MTIAERIQLHRLGYSKEEINELAKAGYDPAGLTDPPEEPAPAPEDPAPDPTPAPEPTPAPAPEPVDPPAYIAGITKSLEALTRAIQASNLSKTEQPPQQETVDDVFNAIYK